MNWPFLIPYIFGNSLIEAWTEGNNAFSLYYIVAYGKSSNKRPGCLSNFKDLGGVFIGERCLKKGDVYKFFGG